jgi:hypothetical protein
LIGQPLGIIHRFVCRVLTRRISAGGPRRLSNGPAPEVARKVLALVQCGLFDISTGPGGYCKSLHKGWQIEGTNTGALQKVDVLIEARVPFFDAAADVNPLYPNLLRRKLLRQWVNPGEFPYRPGGLDLTPDHHPITDARADRRLTFIGAPAEGLRFMPTSAARPGGNSSVINNLDAWAKEVVAAAAKAASTQTLRRRTATV